MKILVYGRGWIGSQIPKYFNSDEVIFGQARIEDYEEVPAELEAIKPDIVINATGRTGNPNIDWCLDHQVETMISNAYGPRELARACAEKGIYFVHFSTGCLWNEYPDNRPLGIRETDEPRPNSYYSKTKIKGESWVIKIHPTSLILRIRMPFNGSPDKRNLIMKLLSIPEGGTLVNEANSVTCISDLMIALKRLIKLKAAGVYHIVNPGPVYHTEILTMCLSWGVINKMPKLDIVTQEEFHKRKITRDGRSNCILDISKLNSLGINMRHSSFALAECVKELRESLASQVSQVS